MTQKTKMIFVHAQLTFVHSFCRVEQTRTMLSFATIKQNEFVSTIFEAQ